MGNEAPRRAFPGSLEVVGDRCESKGECTPPPAKGASRTADRRVVKTGRMGREEVGRWVRPRSWAYVGGQLGANEGV